MADGPAPTASKPSPSDGPPLPDYYDRLSADDKVTLQQARQTLSQAMAANATAVAAAKTAAGKPQQDFDTAKKAFAAAVTDKSNKLSAVAKAFTKLATDATAQATAVQKQADATKDMNAGDPVAAVADQLGAIQPDLDALKAALGDAVKSQAALDTAGAALQKASLAKPGPFDPTAAEVDSGAVTLAKAQLAVDSAKAGAQLDKANHVYAVVEAQMNPDTP